jgi:uncharacterized protein YjbJ (UPF0337 family)
MNRDRIKGRGKQIKGDVKSELGKATNNESLIVSGKKDKLAGKIQNRFGVAKDRTAKKINDIADKAKRP